MAGRGGAGRGAAAGRADPEVPDGRAARAAEAAERGARPPRHGPARPAAPLAARAAHDLRAARPAAGKEAARPLPHPAHPRPRATPARQLWEGPGRGDCEASWDLDGEAGDGGKGFAAWTVEGREGRLEGYWGAEPGVSRPQHPDTGFQKSTLWQTLR